MAQSLLDQGSGAKSADASASIALPPQTEIMKCLLQLRESLTPKADDEYRFLDYCRRHLELSQSQIFQDLFVLFRTNDKRGGFFVEFGASDGLSLSNTHLLEKQFGWSGIVAEPARIWHQKLRQTRGCAIDHRCVWGRSGEHLEFNEAVEPEYSTLLHYSSGDRHATKRVDGRKYAVETVTLNDLLSQHNAPRLINYLSVDTEGSELEILEAFDFNLYDVRLVSVEHNYTSSRSKIRRLLESRGFRRTLEAISLWDDWYVNANEVSLSDGR